MLQATPITLSEFFACLKQCMPASGSGNKISVAFSGGPDSTCLLFLLKSTLDQLPVEHSFRCSLEAIHVNHNLQASSHEMQEKCADIAQSLRVPYIAQTIPWGTKPFVKQPENGDAFEGVARAARYQILFQTLGHGSTVAFGHHKDDQLETAIMRLANGSTYYGAAGMPKLRRWGMGEGRKDGQTWFGLDGLSKFVIRPLLSFSKDRLLATCDAHGLSYVTDSTNFQPEITLRNAIRSRFSEDITTDKLLSICDKKSNNVDNAIKTLHSFAPSGSKLCRQSLYEGLGALSTYVGSIDEQVDAWLVEHNNPSAPPGTFLVSPKDFSMIDDELVRFALIRRILRYVSPHPWGSVAAESHRKSKSIQQVDKALRCAAAPYGNIGSFSAGSDVHWSPVRLNGAKILLPETFKLKQVPLDAPGEDMWIASRLPPKNGQKPAVDSSHDLHSSSFSCSSIDVLWDNRFRIHFDLETMTRDTRSKLSQLRVEASRRWHLPQVYLPDSPKKAPLTFDEMIKSKVEDRWTWSSPSTPGLIIQWIRLLNAR